MWEEYGRGWKTLKGELGEWGIGVLGNLPFPIHPLTKTPSPPPILVSHSGTEQLGHCDLLLGGVLG